MHGGFTGVIVPVLTRAHVAGSVGGPELPILTMSHRMVIATTPLESRRDPVTV